MKSSSNIDYGRYILFIDGRNTLHILRETRPTVGEMPVLSAMAAAGRAAGTRRPGKMSVAAVENNRNLAWKKNNLA